MFIDTHLGTLHEPLTGRQWAHDEALQRARRRATLLQRAGLSRGQRVFLHHGNRPEFFVDVLAAWLLGACAVPVDPRFTAFELEQLARAVGPVCSVWDGEPPPGAQAALQAAGVRLLGLDEGAAVDESLFAAGLPWLDDAALLLFTSGTTGQPKGVVHTHRSLRARWNHQRERLGVDAFARTLCAVPTHFAWGLVGHGLYTWLSGQSLYLLPAFRQDVVLRLGALCDEHAITCLPSVPAMWRLALKMAAPPRRGSLLRVTCGTSPLPAALWRGIPGWSGAREVLNIYGITETGWLAGTTLDEAGGHEEAAVGEPWGAVIRVLEGGDTARGPQRLRRCAPGEVGHVWVQTPALMQGYHGRDDLSAQVIAGGWFSTGDLGTLDERGRLFLRGREKEMINAGGAKVYPADIDTALQALPGVEDVCCFAVDDPLLGENVAVALVLAERGEAALAALYAESARRLAAHQLPRRWYLVDQIERTARGKLDRQRVAAHCATLRPLEQRALERLAATGAGS